MTEAYPPTSRISGDDIVDDATVETTDVLILGGGIAGLTAAGELGGHAICVERDRRPGGLVRTEHWQGYWFDRVIHLLYFSDRATQAFLESILGGVLAPCPPIAWVECSAGITRYPLQMNLGGLEPEAALRCVRDFEAVSARADRSLPANYEDLLLLSFGRSMFEIFFGPYNRKMWKRPLIDLAPVGHTWNIARPDLDQVRRGIEEPAGKLRTYNANAWYPRPRAGAPQRGMELLPCALATRVHDLRLEHRVEHVDLTDRVVSADHRGQPRRFRFGEALISTMPLPRLLSICAPVPDALRRDAQRLIRNRVWTVAFAIEGPRPVGRGLWRYYTDETIIFNRLIYTHEIDPLCAPPDGWGVMAEITEPAESTGLAPAELELRARRDLERVGGLPPGCRIVQCRILLVDPAYVVFTPDNQSVMEQAREFLIEHDVHPLGRYGNWEYSSMSAVIRDGRALGQRLNAGRRTLGTST